MILATWNVNSLKIRLPQVQEWLSSYAPDVLCLQETKLEDAKFPSESLAVAGYQSVYSGQRTYNGVAILCRTAPKDVAAGIPGYDDAQKRVVAATVQGVRVICVYVPNGESVGSDKYRYKLDWLKRMTQWLEAEMAHYPHVAVLGDFNVAPEERDVHDPAVWEGKVLFSAQEREAFREFIQLGLVDSLRLFEQGGGYYTWWDYRMNSFKRKLGLRIDHILLSPKLASCCDRFVIDRDMRGRERPSDHAPVLVEISP